jgi:hypothetical protein
MEIRRIVCCGLEEGGHLMGKIKLIWPAHVVVRGQNPLVQRIAASTASGDESALPLALDSKDR